MAAPVLPLLAGATPPDSGGGPGGAQNHEDMKQRYCLKWNNYQSNVTSTFKELLAVEDFVDITLSAEGGALRAHKVVLSACSPYFRDILKVKHYLFIYLFFIHELSTLYVAHVASSTRRFPKNKCTFII